MEKTTLILELGLVILETVARIVPTKRNLSIIDGIHRIISILIPNRRKRADGID